MSEVQSVYPLPGGVAGFYRAEWQKGWVLK